MLNEKMKKKSNLSFLIFFVLLITIFCWPKYNNDLVSNRYLLTGNSSSKSKKSAEVLLNLEKGAILFLAIVIIILLFTIFFVFKSNDNILKSFYSYFKRDEEYHIYNELAKICEFSSFNFQMNQELKNCNFNNVLSGFAAIAVYLNYFQNQKDNEGKKLYFFRYEKDNENNERFFYQSSTTLNETDEYAALQKIFTLEELIDEKRKDTDYHDFLGIDKKIDEIERFNFFNEIFENMKSHFQNDGSYLTLISAIKKMIFFLFSLDNQNRKEEKTDDFQYFKVIHDRATDPNPKKDLVKKYSTILNKINGDITSLNENGNIDVDNNDYKINVRLTENENKVYYIPDGIFISNLMDLYKKILSLRQDDVAYAYEEEMKNRDNVPQVNGQMIMMAKFFFCFFTHDVLQNYLFFLKKLMFIEDFKKRYQKEIDKEKFLAFIKKNGDGYGSEKRIKTLLYNHLYGENK